MNIIPRAAWSDYPNRTFARMKTPAAFTYIHHTASPAGSPQNEMLQLDAIERFHVKSNGWAAIGYNFLIFPSGNVYEGRGFGAIGAHIANYNSKGHGISFVGHFRFDTPTEAALSACRELIAHGLHDGFISLNHTILGHRDVANTECPGNNLYLRLDDIRQGALPDDILTCDDGTGHEVTMDRATYDKLGEPRPAILRIRRP